jgi:hypothetical protein
MSQFQLSCLILNSLTVIGAVMSVNKRIYSTSDPYKYYVSNYSNSYSFILAFSFIFILSMAHFCIVPNPII